MLSRPVLIVGTLVCVWAQLRPFSFTQALIGDAAAPTLVALLALAMIGLRRVHASAGDEPRAGFGPWIGLAEEKPAVVFVLVVAAVLGNGPLRDPNPAIVLTGVAWLAAGACRRARGGSPAFDARAEAWTGFALVAAAVLFASFVGRGPLPIEEFGGPAKCALGLAVIAAACFHLLVARTDACDEERTRLQARTGCLLLCATAILLVVPGVVLEIPSNLDFTVYAGLPLTWLVLCVLGKHAHESATRAGWCTPGSTSIRLARGLHVPTQAWCVILAAKLAAVCAYPSCSLGRVLMFSAVASLALLVLGWALGRSPRTDADVYGRARPGVERALVPLLAPALALAILHQLPNAARWQATILPRGQAASILEALPVPMLGAAFIIAYALDLASRRRTHAAVAALGVVLLGLSLMTFQSSVRYEPIVAWFGTPTEIEHAGLRDLYAPIALLVGVATALTVVRLLGVVQGRRPSLLILIVPIAAGFAWASRSAPVDGPVAATWAAVFGCATWFAVEVGFLALAVPRSRVIES